MATMMDIKRQLAAKYQKQTENSRLWDLADFCHERLKVRDKTGTIVDFDLLPTQKKYLAMKADAVRRGKPKRFILLKFRRGGYTTLEQAQHYMLCATKMHQMCATLSQAKDSTLKIGGIFNLFREKDPRLDPADKSDAKMSLSFESTKSQITLGTAGSTAFGRGDTLQRVHGSEVAFWCEGPNQFTDIDNLVAGLSEAASHGEVVLESTPNGINWFAHKYKEAKAGINDFTPIFLRWFDDPTNVAPPTEYSIEEILDTVSEVEKELVRRHALRPEQVAWRRAKIKAVGRLFPQEYPEDDETCFLTSGTLFFDVDLLMTLLETYEKTHGALRDKAITRNVPGGKIVRLIQPQKDEKYVAGADCSEGLPTSDPSFCGFMRKSDGKQVGWIYGKFRPEQFAKHICDEATAYNNAFVGVERNNHGHSVLNTLVNVIGYKSLFYSRNHRGEPGPSSDGSGQVGWDTNSATRPVMLDDLEQFLRESPQSFSHREFLSECLSFKLQPSGKYEADPGAHDDMVMGWAVCNQMRKYDRHRARVIVLG